MTTPMAYLDDKRMELLSLSRELERSAQGLADKKKQDLVRLSAVLEAVSPLKVIAKGYSAVFADDGRLIRSVKSVAVGDAISFRTVDGTVDASVTDIKETEIKG